MFKKYAIADIIVWVAYLWLTRDWDMGWKWKLIIGYILTVIVNSAMISIAAQNDPKSWSEVKERERILMSIFWPFSFILGLIHIFQNITKNTPK